MYDKWNLNKDNEKHRELIEYINALEKQSALNIEELTRSAFVRRSVIISKFIETLKEMIAEVEKYCGVF